MRIQTIVIILITFFITILLMQNTGTVKFTILFKDVYISKLVMLTLVSVFGFILGFLVGRPKTVRRLGGDFNDPNQTDERTDTLSDEDKEYIN
jgi:uncharacterized integral membrane protein